MKKIHVSRSTIIRAIQVAALALFWAARPADAAPVYTPSNYSINGTKVTGFGTSNSAYFNDTAATGYTVTIPKTANLSDPVKSEIEIDHGTVDNRGTLAYEGNDEFLGGVILNNAGNVNNSGAINAPDSYSVQGYGTNGQINNTRSGTMTSLSGTYFMGGCTVNNAGSIIATDPGFGVPVESGSPGTVHNSGTMTGSAYGIQLNFNSAEGNSLVTNSGLISANETDARAIEIFGPGTVVCSGGQITATGSSTNAIEIDGGTGTVSNLNRGTISGDYQAVLLTGGGTVTNSFGATLNGSAAGAFIQGNGTVTNAGEIFVLDNTIESQAIGVSGTGTVLNTGRIFVSDHDLAEGIFVASGQVTNQGSIRVADTQSAYGITNENGTVVNGAFGNIYADGAAGIGIFTEGASTVTNSGFVEGGEYGISMTGDNATVIVNGGSVGGGTDAILLSGHNGSVTIKGTAIVGGTIEGTDPALGNVLHLQLTGLTGNQGAKLKAYVLAHPHTGTFTIVRFAAQYTFSWADFANVTD